VTIVSLFSPFIYTFDSSIDTRSPTKNLSSPLRAPYLSQSTSPQRIQQQPEEQTQYIRDFVAIFSSPFCSLMYVASFSMGVFMGSFTIIMGSIWLEDIFHVASSTVGIISLAIFVGELISALSLSTFIDQYGVYAVSTIPYGTLLIVSSVCCLLSLTLGPSVGGITVVVIFTFFLYYGWESFFICHQMLCIQNAPNKDLVSLTLLIFFVSLNAGSIVGTQISPIIWNDGKGLPFISLIWIGCHCLSIAVYVALHKMHSAKQTTTNGKAEYEPV